MATTEDLSFLQKLPVIDNSQNTTEVKEKNAQAILNFIDWVNDNKESIYFSMVQETQETQEAFFNQLQSALLSVYPEKEKEINTLTDSMLKDIEKQNTDLVDQDAWPPLSQLMTRIIAMLTSDSEHQYRERIEQHWNSVKDNAPITAIISTIVQDSQGNGRSYSREDLSKSINFSFNYNSSENWFSEKESAVIMSMMSRLGFKYVTPAHMVNPPNVPEKVHFLIDSAATSQNTFATLVTAVQDNTIPVLLLPASGLSSTQNTSPGYDKDWLLGVLRALRQFLGMPELSDTDPANYADGMASSDQIQESMFNAFPEMKGLLEGRLSLSSYEESAYIARRLMHTSDVTDIKRRLFDLATAQGIAVDANGEQQLNLEEMSDGIQAAFIKEANYFTPETRERITRDAMETAKQHMAPEKITWEIVSPLIRLGIIAEKHALGYSGPHEHTLLTLIKDAVPAEQVYGRKSISEFTNYPATIYGKANRIAVNYTAPDSHVFGTSNTFPEYAQADGLVRVYNYAFIDTPRMEGFGRSEKGDDYKSKVELMAMTDKRKALVRSVLAEIEEFSAIRFREVPEGGDVDFDFAVYRNDDQDNSRMLAFMSGELSHRRVRLGDKSTFGKDEEFALGVIRHETLHGLGAEHRDLLVKDDMPSVMSHDSRYTQFKFTDKLTIQLIHGKNPDSTTPQPLFREAKKIWLAPGSWAAKIELNAAGNLDENYVVSGFVKNQSVLRFSSAYASKADFHRNIHIDALDGGKWRIRFTENTDDPGKTVLITGMGPLEFPDLQVEFMSDKVAWQLQPDNTNGLKWVGYSLQNNQWVVIADTPSPDAQKDNKPQNTLLHNDETYAALQEQKPALLADAIVSFQDSASTGIPLAPSVTIDPQRNSPLVTAVTLL